MDALELKSDLHRLIRETEDIGILQKIKDAFYKFQNEQVVLSEKEERMLEIGLRDTKEGRVRTNKAAKERRKNWIKERS